jgi:hypothetical protein
LVILLLRVLFFADQGKTANPVVQG